MNSLHLAAFSSVNRRSFSIIRPHKDDHESKFLFDPYLPPKLRLQEGLKDAKETEAVRPIKELTEQLLKSLIESSWKIEHLGRLGLHQNRWPAFIWLFKEFLLFQRSSSHYHTHRPLNGWAQAPVSLKLLVSDQSLVEQISQRQPHESLERSLDSVVERPGLSVPSVGFITSLDLLGYLWMCLGSIIIQAVNMDSEAIAPTMAYVYQAIALMHHHDVIPRTIYDYGSAKDASAINRPPTLRLLHSRILTILSDAAWTASEAQILREAEIFGAKFTHMGYELPGAEYRPRIRSIGLEVWLEFVLWCCVESGRIGHASWIINRLIDGEQLGTPWSVVCWNTLHQNNLGDSNIENIEKQSVRAASTAAGYSEGMLIFYTASTLTSSLQNYHR